MIINNRENDLCYWFGYRLNILFNGYQELLQYQMMIQKVAGSGIALIKFIFTNVF